MPRGIRNKPIAELPPADPQDMTPPAEGARLAAMLLKRHYRPMGFYEVVGHHTREVWRKKASGEQYLAEPSEWKPGEKADPPVAGALGFADKLWAGTVVRLPFEEAKTIQKAGIGEPVLED